MPFVLNPDAYKRRKNKNLNHLVSSQMELKAMAEMCDLEDAIWDNNQTMN